MLWCDTAGLGIFTVVGIQTASRILPQDNPFFFVFIGVLTGVGGGVLRDIMAGETPYILVREIYASAAIAGVLPVWSAAVPWGGYSYSPGADRYRSDPLPGRLFSLESAPDPIEFFLIH